MTETIHVLQREAVKLGRNRSGYTWEIKLVGDIDDAQLLRLEELNQKMNEKYGEGGEEE